MDDKTDGQHFAVDKCRMILMHAEYVACSAKGLRPSTTLFRALPQVAHTGTFSFN